jgi:hypothetical protein
LNQPPPSLPWQSRDKRSILGKRNILMAHKVGNCLKGHTLTDVKPLPVLMGQFICSHSCCWYCWKGGRKTPPVSGDFFGGEGSPTAAAGNLPNDLILGLWARKIMEQHPPLPVTCIQRLSLLRSRYVLQDLQSEYWSSGGGETVSVRN